MAPHGWSGTILRIDLTKKEIIRESTLHYTREYLGGRGINHAILFREVPSDIKAFDPENLLIFGTGPLSGTLIPSSGRTQVTFKSPYPSGWGDSNVGGHWGPELKFAGFDHLIIQGKAAKPTYIWIDDDQVELRDASHIWSKVRYEAEEIIRKEIGDEEIRIMSIGPGGENLVWFANIMNNLTNSAGRTGGGAVMGSKRLKLIAVRGTKGVGIAHPEKLIEISDYISSTLKEDPLYPIPAELGTPGGIDFLATIGMLPRKNWYECGIWEKQNKINAKSLVSSYEVTRSGCFNCPIHCHCLYKVREGKFMGVIGGGPEYETICAFGNKCLSDDMPAILHMNTLCNQYGLDTVGTGNILALLMDFYDHKIITRKETDGIPMIWGDTEAMITMIHKIANGEGIGKKLAVDSFEFAKRLGKGAEKFVKHNKGLTPTGVEIRSAMGTALSFCLSPRGSHHLSGIPTAEYAPNPEVAERLCGYKEGADIMSYHPQAKAKLVNYYENLFIVIDSLGICKFPYGHFPFWHGSRKQIDELEKCLTDSLEVVTGEKFSWPELMLIADRVYNIERIFINNHGMTRKDDEPCLRDLTEECPGEHPMGSSPLPPIDKEKYDKMLDAYYELRGWNKEGKPSKETRRKLGLDEDTEKNQVKGLA